MYADLDRKDEAGIVVGSSSKHDLFTQTIKRPLEAIGLHCCEMFILNTTTAPKENLMYHISSSATERSISTIHHRIR
jgi:hypothetical protein